MRAVVIFPWRGGDRDREAAYLRVKDHYSHLGIPMFEGDAGGDRFSPGASRNIASRLAGDWDVALFVDADCVIPLSVIGRGFGHSLTSGHVTLPWDAFYSMSEEGHAAGMDDRNPIGFPMLERAWKAHSIPAANPIYAPGGNLIVPRAEWDRVGGYDERFTGWSHEDAAFLFAVGEFDRLSGPMYHFWHRSRAYEAPIPSFYYAEYANRPVTQNLIDEGRTIEGFGGWG